MIPCLHANWRHRFRDGTKRSGRRYTCHHFEIAGLRCLNDYLSQISESFVGLTGTDRKTPRRYRCKSTTPSPYRVPKVGTALRPSYASLEANLFTVYSYNLRPVRGRIVVVSSIAYPSCSTGVRLYLGGRRPLHPTSRRPRLSGWSARFTCANPSGREPNCGNGSAPSADVCPQAPHPNVPDGRGRRRHGGHLLVPHLAEHARRRLVVVHALPAGHLRRVAGALLLLQRREEPGARGCLVAAHISFVRRLRRKGEGRRTRRGAVPAEVVEVVELERCSRAAFAPEDSIVAVCSRRLVGYLGR